MVTIKFGDRSFELDIDEQLKTLTGDESMLVEDYLGGWGNFRNPANVTRSSIVLVWLAKRQAGEQTSFAEIAATPGLIFGDVFDVTDDGDAPSDPDEDPAFPLGSTTPKSDRSNGGSTDADSSKAIFDSTGTPSSAASTG